MRPPQAGHLRRSVQKKLSFESFFLRDDKSHPVGEGLEGGAGLPPSSWGVERGLSLFPTDFGTKSIVGYGLIDKSTLLRYISIGGEYGSSGFAF